MTSDLSIGGRVTTDLRVLGDIHGNRNANGPFQITAGADNTDGAYIELWDDDPNSLVSGNMTLLAGQTGSISFRHRVGGTFPERMVINSSGQVGIGTSSPSATLHVHGNLKITDPNTNTNNFRIGADGFVRARQIDVDLDPIPDYVFEPTYDLMGYDELRTYIETHHHLPRIPSAAEYEARGSINLGEMNVLLLEKVEELTLYVLELEQRLREVEAGKDDPSNR